MKIYTTDRGAAFIAMLFFLWASAIALHDKLLALLALTTSLIPIIDFTKLFLSSHRLIVGVRTVPTSDVWVWERPWIEVIAGRFFEPLGLPKWVKVRGVEARDGLLLYRFETEFKYSGIYRLDKIGIKVSSRLGLFELIDDIPLNILFRVKPTTLFWLQRALAVLGIGRSSRIHTIHEVLSQVIYLRSIPEEYAGSREYQPGDNLRFIDWKSTARRQRLFVKEFRGGAGIKPLLSFDLRCMGPYTCDAIASAVLSVAIGFVVQGLQVLDLYEADMDRILSFNNPYKLLSHIVRRILDSVIIKQLDLYEFIEPKALEEIRRILMKITDTNIIPININKARQKILTHGNIVYITALLHATGDIIDLALSIARNGGAMSLIVPAEPWVDADDLMAEKIRISFHRAIKKLSSLGVKVFPCGRGAPRTLTIETSP